VEKSCRAYKGHATTIRMTVDLSTRPGNPAGAEVTCHPERLGHSNPAYTMATYQHVLPGMQAEAATTFEHLIQETRRSEVRRKPW